MADTDHTNCFHCAGELSASAISRSSWSDSCRPATAGGPVALRYILWPLLALSFMLIWYFTFTIIANLIGAPFNGFLAERVEAHLKGDAYKPFDSGSFIKEIAPALLNEIGKISLFSTVGNTSAYPVCDSRD